MDCVPGDAYVTGRCLRSLCPAICVICDTMRPRLGPSSPRNHRPIGQGSDSTSASGVPEENGWPVIKSRGFERTS